MLNSKDFTYKYRLEYPVFETFKELLEYSISKDPDKAAYEYFVGGQIQKTSFIEFYHRVHALGTAFCELGIDNKHVAVIGQNSFDYITVFLTMLASAGTVVPIDKELPEEDYMNIVKDADLTAIIYDKKYEETLKAHKDELPNLKYYICFQREEDEDNFLSFNRVLEMGKQLYENGDARYKDSKRGSTDELASLPYTSGTTGLMKGVMLSEKNIIKCTCYGLQVEGIYDKCLSVLPYNHTYEQTNGILVALENHTTLCINDNVRHVLKNLQLFKPEYILLVPAFIELFYKKIWATAKQEGKEAALKVLIATSNGLRKVGVDKRRELFKSIHDTFGGNLIKIVSGGAPLRAEIGDFFEAIGIKLANGYGITECSPLVAVNQEFNNDPSTVGIPLPCTEIQIQDPDEYDIGEICVKSLTTMLGYYKRPDLTEEVIDKDGWFHTGDYGTFNEIGQLKVTGRKKNLIVLENGKNIFPEEIENYLSGIPYIQEVLVFSVKNELGNEVGLAAEIYAPEEKLKEFKIDDVEKSLKKDIAKACKHLPSYKQIVKFYLRPIPFVKTTTNKIKRSSLMFNN